MLVRLLIVLLCLNLIILANSDETAPRVETLSGAMKGCYEISQRDRKYMSFKGIPYAKPPIGKLRFQPPQPILPWIVELLATKFGSPCIQYVQFSDPAHNVKGAEDCLYLNIFVPVRNKTEKISEKMPVLVGIHGGAFQFGSGEIYGARYLMDSDVILVTINYRLGPMGFLSTEDEVVPGNMGLKDQNMALRWISQNIEWFGGDPKKVTLFGQSAGIHYHYLSKMSVGLFRGGISFSGTAFDCWAQTENSLEKTKKLSYLMECPTNTSREMIDCLRDRPARDIVQNQYSTNEFMYCLNNLVTLFGPVVEKGSHAPFIDKTPVEIVSNGEVQDLPWVVSVVSEEGLYPVAEFIANDTALKQLNDNWDHLAPRCLFFNDTIPKEKHNETSRIIKKHYLGTKPIDLTTTNQLVQMESDRLFFVYSKKAALMQAKVNQNPVYYILLSYRGNQSSSKYYSGTAKNYGVCHGDNMAYVVETPWMDPTTTQRDREMQKVLIDICVSFATNGIPNVAGVKWSKLDPSKKEFQYLHIASPTEINMDSNANFGDEKFWNSIKFNENVLNT